MKHISHTFLSFLIFMACVVPGASALTVATEPGGLADAVGDAFGASELIVNGAVDASDFDFISEKMPALRSLDLGGAVISAYDGAPTLTGRTSSPANVLPDCALMLPQLKQLALPADLEAIGDGALGGSGITDVVIPAGVKSIGVSAFAECKSLKAISVPESVGTLGAGAFKGCTALSTAVIQAAVPEVPDELFMGCVGLAEVQVPPTVKTIGNDAFNGCLSMSAFGFPTSLVSIGDRAFYGSGIATADFGVCSNLKSIGGWAFADCNSLATVDFNPSVSSIGTGAFFNDASLMMDVLPAQVTKVRDFAFRGIGGGNKELAVAEAVDSIGAYAFANWSHVQKLVLPESLEYIGDGAMANWTALDSIVAEAPVKVPALGADVWRGVAQKDVKLVVPLALMGDYEAAPQWKEFDVTSKDLSTRIDITDAAVATDGVTARFSGMMLDIDAPVDIVDVTLFDIRGRGYRFQAQTDGKHASVDTSAWNAPVMIVRVLLSDGTVAALKLSRGQ